VTEQGNKVRYRAGWKEDVESDIRKVGIVNWRQWCRMGIDGGEQLERSLSFLGSGATEGGGGEEEEEKEKEEELEKEKKREEKEKRKKKEK